MTVGTKYIKRINCVLAGVRRCSGSTGEGMAAEPCGGTGMSQDHRVTQPGSLWSCCCLGRKEIWLKPFMSVQLIPLLTQGLGGMFFQLGFCFPQGGSSWSLLQLGMLQSSWATAAFPAGIKGDPQPGIQDRFCLWCQRIWSGIGGALLPCVCRGIPDDLGGRSQAGVVQEGRGGWWLCSDSGAASTAQGSLGTAGDRRGDDGNWTSLKAKCGQRQL